MKKTAIFFLLIALTFSKLEIKDYKPLLKNFLNSYISQEDIEKYAQQCNDDGQDLDKCKAVNLGPDEFQCCYFYITGMENICQLSPKPIDEVKKILESNVIKPFAREVIGAYEYGPFKSLSATEEDLPSKLDVEAKCSDGDFSFSIENNEYTDADINILQGEDYCLNHFDGDESEQPLDEKCENYKLLDSSKKANIDCGYLEATAMGKTQRTCFLFNYELYSNYLNIFQKYINEAISSPEASQMGITSLVIYNAKGEKVVLYSSNSNMLHISLCFLLFILILF